MVPAFVPRSFPRLVLAALPAFALMATGCNLKLENPKDDPKVWPEYVQSGLSGTVFGTPWKAVTAVVRDVPQAPTEVSLEVFAEPMANVCLNNTFTTKPSVSMILPKGYTASEYVYELGTSTTGNPLAFRSSGAVSKELIAEMTKLRIDAVTPTGFEAELFAQGTDAGVISQINGHISVIDCGKAVDFSVWNQMAGTYQLNSLDGQAEDGRSSIIELDTHGQFYDRGSNQFLKAMVFPLYKSIRGTVTEKFNFGPMDGLGISQATSANGVSTLTYSYHGPLTYLGRAITLNLDLRAVKSAARMDIAYTFEIPGEVPVTTHQIVLLK